MKMLQAFRSQFLNSENKPKDFTDKMGLFDILNKSYELTQDRLTELMIQVHKPDLVINISRDACGVFVLYRANEIIEEGRSAFHRAHDHYRLHGATT